MPRGRRGRVRAEQDLEVPPSARRRGATRTPRSAPARQWARCRCRRSLLHQGWRVFSHRCAQAGDAQHGVQSTVGSAMPEVGLEPTHPCGHQILNLGADPASPGPASLTEPPASACTSACTSNAESANAAPPAPDLDALADSLRALSPDALRAHCSREWLRTDGARLNRTTRTRAHGGDTRTQG